MSKSKAVKAKSKKPAKKLTQKELRAKRREAKNYGMKKIRKGEKLCWVSHESKNGWSLGLGLNKRTLWLRNVRFATREEVERMVTSAVVFVHTKNSKTVPQDKA